MCIRLVMALALLTLVALYVGATWAYLDFVVFQPMFWTISDPDVSRSHGFAILGLIGISSIPFVALGIVCILKPDLRPDW